MPRSNRSSIPEKSLTKGELRKLRALQKSIGEQLGGEAFAKWYAQNGQGARPSDRNAELIEKALNPLINRIRISRGAAYAVRRGRGRFIVEPVELKG